MRIRTYLARIKRRLFKKPFLADKKYPPYWFDKVLKSSNVLAVQIGSNDGKTGDPLYPLFLKNTHWKGLFVEPVPYLFQRLQQNYPDTARFSFENVAINEGAKLPFFWVDPSIKGAKADLPFWYDQMGSFNKEHIVEGLGADYEPFIRSEELEGITLDTLFERNQMQHFDIIHIDTEGYDWKVLSQLNLSKYHPKFILYESNHLSDTDLKASYQFLREQYHIFSIGIDSLAVSKKVGKEVIAEMGKYMQAVG